MSDQNENIQKFSFSNFFKENKLKIISVLILIILIIFITIGFKEFKKRENHKVSIEFNKAKILIEKNKKKEASKILETIIYKKNKFYSPSSLNLIIENNLIDDKKLVLSYYDEIISNNNLDKEIKNLFIFKKVTFLGDTIEENELLKNLKPIIKSNSVWKNTVSDYIIKYYYSKNEFNKAKEFQNP